MNNKHLRFAIVGVMALVVTTLVLAQQRGSPGGPGDRLATVAAFLEEGKVQEARQLIATIAPGSPEYAAARCYDAMCLQELGDHRGFLKAIESGTLHLLSLPSEGREDFAFREIDALFHCRKLEELPGRIEAFKRVYSGSARLALATEYQMATLFERGVKKVDEARAINESEKRLARWEQGVSSLRGFLRTSEAYGASAYSGFPKRNLKKDRWTALILLGEEAVIAAEVGRMDATDREAFELSRAGVLYRFQPDEVDRNVRLMSEFLDRYPATSARSRLEFDMASMTFRRGEQLCKEADVAERDGDDAGARQKRETARRYFEFARPLQARAVVDGPAGIEPSDIRDLHEDLLCSFYWDRDDARLHEETGKIVSKAVPGDLDWLLARVFDGAAMCSQADPHLKEAAAILDEVLEVGFKNKPDHDRFVAVGARWRVHISLRLGEMEDARRIVRLVENSSCTKNIRTAFVRDHQGVLASENLNVR